MGLAPVRERSPVRSAVPDPRTHNLLESMTPRPQGGPQMAGNSAKRKAVQSEERPKWVPLREDQHSELSTIARELMLARSQKTERLTENTVIRVAVDLVIRHPELLVGDTEDDLRTNALGRFEQLLERERELLAGGNEEDPGEGQ